MLIFLIVCPFISIKAQDSAEPNTHATSKPQNNQAQTDTESITQDTSKPQNNQTHADTKSDTQDTSKPQNNQTQIDTESDTKDTLKDKNKNQVRFPNQDILTLLNEQARKFADQRKVIMVVFVPLLITLLIFLIWIFLRFRTLAQKMDDIRNGIDYIAKVNTDFKQDLSDVNRRMQPTVTTFDPDELYQALALDSQKNTQEILSLIRTLTPNSTITQDTAFNERKETKGTHKTSKREENISQEFAEFCDSYNLGIRDRQNWTNFIGKYKQNFKIDVLNAEERFLNPYGDIDPVFKTSSAGCFLACYLTVEKLYAVVPVYDLVIESSTYYAGAFGEVFYCSHFDDQRNYQIKKLIQPAIFEPDDKKETWTLKDEGILELQVT